MARRQRSKDTQVMAPRAFQYRRFDKRVSLFPDGHGVAHQ